MLLLKNTADKQLNRTAKTSSPNMLQELVISKNFEIQVMELLRVMGFLQRVVSPFKVTYDLVLCYTRFFISNTFVSNTRLKLTKNKQKLSHTLMLNL